MRCCLAVFALCAASACAQDDVERVTHGYDIRFLTREVENFRGPAIGLSEVNPDSNPVTGDIENGPAPVTPEFLQAAIVANFDEDSWSDERNKISHENGVLYVTQSKEIQEKIGRYLDMLRKRFSRRIIVEAEVLLLSPEAFAAADAVAGILSPEQDKALHDAAADPARGRPIGFLRATAVNGQRVFAADLHEKSYVRDFDVEIAQDQAIADPVTSDLVTGAVLDIRPILANDMATVLMETRFKMARARGMKTFESGTPASCTIQLPSHDVLRAKCTLVLPVGRTALLCTGPIAGEKDWIGAVLVKTALTGQAGGDETASAEKRQVRMYDVSTLTASVNDFPGPRLELSRSRGMAGGAPTTTFVPPEDSAAGMSAEQLVEAIRSNVARDSWKNARNKISIMGDQVVVLQTPAVLDDISKFISVAAPVRNRIIGVEAAVVALDEASWAARRASLSGTPTEDALKDLLAAAAKGGGIRTLSRLSGAGMSTQRFHVWAGADQAFVPGQDVEIANGASGSDPIVDLLETGFVLDIRPTMAGDGKRLQVDLQPRYLAAADPETFDPKAAGIGKIQKLRATSFRVENQMYVPDGGWFLAGVATLNAGGKREVLAMVVRARSMEVK